MKELFYKKTKEYEVVYHSLNHMCQTNKYVGFIPKDLFEDEMTNRRYMIVRSLTDQYENYVATKMECSQYLTNKQSTRDGKYYIFDTRDDLYHFLCGKGIINAKKVIATWLNQTYKSNTYSSIKDLADKLKFIGMTNGDGKYQLVQNMDNKDEYYWKCDNAIYPISYIHTSWKCYAFDSQKKLTNWLEDRKPAWPNSIC